jgi:hypothetical protein
LYYLLSKNYGEKGAVKLVGDRYHLTKRQRYALQRIVVPGFEVKESTDRRISKDLVKGNHVNLDGFNLLILAEVLQSNGYIFECVDSTYRDIASVHGSYRRVNETRIAIRTIGEVLNLLEPSGVTWYLDSPVSNSGRLGHLIREVSNINEWKWEVSLVHNADEVLIAQKQGIAVSSDRYVLSHCKQWFNFSEFYIQVSDINHAHVISLDDLGVTGLIPHF